MCPGSDGARDCLRSEALSGEEVPCKHRDFFFPLLCCGHVHFVLDRAGRALSSRDSGWTVTLFNVRRLTLDTALSQWLNWKALLAAPGQDSHLS